MPGTFELTIRPYVLVYEIHRAEIVVLRDNEPAWPARAA
jgi:hypothetical protein